MSGSVKVVANPIGHILNNVMQIYKMKYKNECGIMYHVCHHLYIYVVYLSHVRIILTP